MQATIPSANCFTLKSSTTPLMPWRAEKQIKGWLRKKKLDLVKSINPKFEDLSRDWFDL
jgi:predicted GIY-YIG superfamily endonuclease